MRNRFGFIRVYQSLKTFMKKLRYKVSHCSCRAKGDWGKKDPTLQSFSLCGSKVNKNLKLPLEKLMKCTYQLAIAIKCCLYFSLYLEVILDDTGFSSLVWWNSLSSVLPLDWLFGTWNQINHKCVNAEACPVLFLLKGTAWLWPVADPTLKSANFSMGYTIKGVPETNLLAFVCSWWIHEFFLWVYFKVRSSGSQFCHFEYSQENSWIHQEQNYQTSLCYTLYHYPLKEWHILFKVGSTTG